MSTKNNTGAVSTLMVRGAWALAWTLCCSASLAILFEPGTTPVDLDEVYWIGSAYYYHLAFQEHDWSHPDWQLLPALENPPVAKYVLGCALAASGHAVTSPDLLGCFYTAFEKTPGAWGTGESYAKREQVVERMSPALRASLQTSRDVPLDPRVLRVARATMLVCAALASLLTFVLGSFAISRPAGLLASQLLLFHPVVSAALNHAGSETVGLLFGTGAVLLVYLLLSFLLSPPPLSLRRGSILATSAGVLIALACAAKMNWLIVLVLAAGFLSAFAVRAWVRNDRRRSIETLLYGGGTLAVAFVVFVAVNPTIVQDFTGGLIACVREHRLTEGVQAAFLPDHLTTLSAKLDAVGTLTFFHPAVCAVFLLASLWLCSLRETAAGYIGAWWLVSFVCVTLWLPFPWGRYVLPVVGPSVLVAAFILSKAFTGLVRAAGSRRATAIQSGL